jgi:hypothetical protein
MVALLSLSRAGALRFWTAGGGTYATVVVACEPVHRSRTLDPSNKELHT